MDSLPTALEKSIEIPGNATITYYRAIEERRKALADTLAKYHFSDPKNIFGQRIYWTDGDLHLWVNFFLLPFLGNA